MRVLLQFKNEEYRLTRDALIVARSRYEQATKKAFVGVSIPGILQPEWQHFIEAGEEFLTSIDGGAAYPAEHDRCLYCQQTLSAAAVELIRKYRDYCNSELRNAVTEADKQMRDVTEKIRTLDIEDRSRKLKEQGAFGADRDALTTVQNFLAKAQQLKDAVLHEQRLYPVLRQ